MTPREEYNILRTIANHRMFDMLAELKDLPVYFLHNNETITRFIVERFQKPSLVFRINDDNINDEMGELLDLLINRFKSDYIVFGHYSVTDVEYYGAIELGYLFDLAEIQKLKGTPPEKRLIKYQDVRRVTG